MEQKRDKSSSKKAYVRPVLTKYGELEEITGKYCERSGCRSTGCS